MNDRRRFLQVLGGAAIGVGCGTSANRTSSGTGGEGTGGDESASSGSTTSSTSSTSSTSASSSSGAPCEATPVGTKIGEPSAYAATGLHVVSNLGALIGRDAGGLYALSSICTHQGCDMSTLYHGSPNGVLMNGNEDIRCACHGSEFGPDGAVLRGPAASPLPAFPLALGCDGFLYVNENSTTSSSTRLKV
jgi:cytochrome b6-f complex iron-sulfur subunit